MGLQLLKSIQPPPLSCRPALLLPPLNHQESHVLRALPGNAIKTPSAQNRGWYHLDPELRNSIRWRIDDKPCNSMNNQKCNKTNKYENSKKTLLCQEDSTLRVQGASKEGYLERMFTPHLMKSFGMYAQIVAIGSMLIDGSNILLIW